MNTSQITNDAIQLTTCPSADSAWAHAWHTGVSTGWAHARHTGPEQAGHMHGTTVDNGQKRLPARASKSRIEQASELCSGLRYLS